MMLNRPPETLGNPYSDISKKMNADYNACISLHQQYWAQANLCCRAEAGDQSLNTTGGALTGINNNRAQFYFNRIRPMCNTVSGKQRQNRKKLQVVPLEGGDQQTADQWTKVLLHIFKATHLDETLSEAFHQGACISGLNLLQVYVDYRNDPVNGEIKVDNLQFNQFLMDPFWRKTDLSDCRFIWRRSYLNHAEVASLLPDVDYNEIMSLQSTPTGTGRDGKFNWQPEAYGQTQTGFLAYDEYYYRDYRKQIIAVDNNTLEVTEIDENTDVELFKKYNEAIGADITIKEQTIPTVRMCIRVQDRVFYDGPSGDDNYMFVPVVGFYSSMLPYMYSRLQSLTSAMLDPQALLNRRINLSADLAESVLNSGWIFKEDAVIDVKHLFQTGQGRIIPLKRTANIADVQQIQPPQIPPSFFTLQETFAKELSQVTGINDELMGMPTNAKAGIQEMWRTGQALVTLQPLFDRFDCAMKLLGERLMEKVRSTYGPGKIRSILEGEQPAPAFYRKAFGKYHCTVELGFNTDTQRQMQAAQMIQLTELGYRFSPRTMLNAFTLQNKDEVIREMEQQQQAQMQQAQQQAQVQMQEIQARTQLAQARTMADFGLGQERISRIEENKALAEERRSEAVKDDFQALLNYAKAIKEIDQLDKQVGGIDLQHLQQILALKKLLETPQQEGMI